MVGISKFLQQFTLYYMLWLCLPFLLVVWLLGGEKPLGNLLECFDKIIDWDK